MSWLVFYAVGVLAIDMMIIGAKGDPETSMGLQLVLMYVLLFFGIPFVATAFLIFIFFGALSTSPRSGAETVQTRTSDHGEYFS